MATTYRSHLARLGIRSRWIVLSLFIASPASKLFAQDSPQELIATQVPQAMKVLNAYHGDAAGNSKRTLHIVYWTPSDRDPAPEYRERLSRVLFSIRDFYRSEMSRLGFGDKTIQLATQEDGLLKIHMVKGSGPYANYDVQSGALIRRECLPVLRGAKIDADKETIVIFCNMSQWDPVASKMTQNSPYYAGGGLRSGTAWQVDSPLLDPQLLSRKEPMLTDGQYGRISVGKYNSIFVGGVCHELGHALGLPHNKARQDEAKAFGTALMGSGNQTFGDNLRGEGRGTFLTLGEGLRLASHPLFQQSEKGIDLAANAKLSDPNLKVAKDGKAFQFSARVTADPPAYAVIAYMDPAGGGDYDATTTTAIPDSTGRFQLQCDALKPNAAGSLRIVVCQANGGRINDSTLEISYTVDSNGLVDVTNFQTKILLSKLAEAVHQKDVASAQVEWTKLKNAKDKGNAYQLATRIAKVLMDPLSKSPNATKKGSAPATVTGKECWLSDCTWSDAKVGWGSPLANRLPDESVLISAGSKLFARGLYAHAPSDYSYDLGGKWKRLQGSAGLADGHSGSVVFVVNGDDKELWRSEKVEESKLIEYDIDVSRVKKLTLTVEESTNGKQADWGVWADPKLQR